MSGRKTSSPEKTDWSDDEHLKMLINQRRFMRNADHVALLGKLIGLGPGSAIVDVGCGLGYLGHMFGKYIRPNGRYFGLDHNHKLLLASRKFSRKHRSLRQFLLVEGEALDLPFKDCSVDVSMCQTLLMHLAHPEDAVKEMVRITKRRGKVVAFEPNNLAWALSSWNNYMERSLADRMQDAEVYCRICEGRKKLGLGDWSIGEKVPLLFMKEGLKNIEVRQNDKVSSVLIPPYDSAERKHACALLCQRIGQEAGRTRGEQKKKYTEWEKFFVAGGGDEKVYRSYMRRRTGWFRRNRQKLIRMAKREELYDIWTVPFYIVIGEKR
jgi:SAM-dependent methyltransferase